MVKSEGGGGGGGGWEGGLTFFVIHSFTDYHTQTQGDGGGLIIKVAAAAAPAAALNRTVNRQSIKKNAFSSGVEQTWNLNKNLYVFKKKK